MVGGETEVVERLGPIFAAIAPGVEARRARRAARGDPSPSEQAGTTATRTAPGTS